MRHTFRSVPSVSRLRTLTKKLRRLLHGGVNVVEIDLIQGGQRRTGDRLLQIDYEEGGDPYYLDFILPQDDNDVGVTVFLMVWRDEYSAIGHPSVTVTQ